MNTISKYLDVEIVWFDINRKGYRLRDISNSHLLNILKFIDTGRGHKKYMTDERVSKLINEAIRRKLIK